MAGRGFDIFAAPMSPKLFQLILSLILYRFADSLKVLMYVPTLSYSHVAFSGHLADLLANEGHTVTILLIEIDPSVRDSGSKLAEVIRVDVGLGDGRLPRTLWRNPSPYEDASPTNPAILVKLVQMSWIFNGICEAVLRDGDLLAELRARRFDVGVTEQYVTCGFGLFQLVGVRSTLWLSATAFYRPQPEAMGVEYPLSYVPELFSSFASEMTLVQRTKNIVIAKTTEWLSRWLSTRAETALVAAARLRSLSSASASATTDGANLGPSGDLLTVAAKSGAILTNILPLLDFSAPTANFIRSIAGITVDMNRHRTADASLAQIWKRVISTTDAHTYRNAADGRNTVKPRGFVLVTFGSIAKTSEMPAEMRASLFRAFRRFPRLNFIVKFERQIRHSDIFDSDSSHSKYARNGSDWKSWQDSEVQRVQDNVFLTKWMPQMDLIAHRLCRGVITHGGWSSVLEAVFYARPLVLMPLFADHFKNAKVIEHRRLGVLVDKQAVGRDTFADALAKIVDDDGITRTSRKFSRMLRDYAFQFAPPRLLVAHELRRISRWSQRANRSQSTEAGPEHHRIYRNGLPACQFVPRGNVSELRDSTELFGRINCSGLGLELNCIRDQELRSDPQSTVKGHLILDQSPGSAGSTHQGCFDSGIDYSYSAQNQQLDSDRVHLSLSAMQVPKFGAMAWWTSNALDILALILIGALLINAK